MAPTSLTRSALAGVAWNYAGSALLVVAQIASTAATARLIAPSGFGAYASAQAAASFAGFFTLSTIGLGLQRRSKLTSKAIGTAVFLSTAGGLFVFAGMWLLASLWADAWEIPEAASLVRVLAAALFLTSLASVPLALVRYSLRFGAAAIAETAAQVVGVTFGVILAVHLHSALALAYGQLVAAAALLLATAALARRDLSLRFDRAEGRDLLTFGGQLGFLYLGTLLANMVPSWVTGRSFGASMLGLYSRASLMAGIPLTYLSTSVTKVLFPLYGHVRDDIKRTRALLSDGLTLATGFTWPLFAVLAGGASVAVDVLLGSRWHGAAPLLQLSVLIACGAFPTGLLTNAAEALGWMRLATLRLVAFIVLLGAAVSIVVFAGLGLHELLIGVAIAQWVTYAITLKPFMSRGLVVRSLIMRSHIVHGTVSIVAFAAALLCADLFSFAGLLAQIAAEFVLVLLLCWFFIVGRSWYPASQVLALRLSNAQLSFGSVLRMKRARLR